MALDFFKNFAKSTLASGIAAGATSLTVATGDGTKFPSVPFNAVIWNKTDYNDPADDPNKEVVRVTAVSTDTFTITKGQEGTSDVAHNTGGKTYGIIAALTAKTLTDVQVRNIISTDFSNSGRFSTRTDGSATLTWGVNGLIASSSGTANSSCRILFQNTITNNFQVYAGNPIWSATILGSSIGTLTGDSYIGMGQPTYNIGAAPTYTAAHIGFKLVKTGGTCSLYATQGNGTTEDASAALTTFASNDVLDLVIIVNSGISADFYWRKNGGAWSSKTTLNTNPPSASTAEAAICNIITTNDASATLQEIAILNCSYTR